MIVVDEIHKCKNSSSDQGHGLLKLVDAEYRIGLTGTLIMNNPLDTYTALKWIGVEHANLTTFKKQYCVYGGISGHEIVGYKNLDILKEELNNCSLRRTKDMLKDLPDKNVITEIIEMNDNHKKFYDAVKKGIKEECDKIDLKAKNVLSLTTRLLQATSCPSVLTNQNIKSSKIERALELIDEIVSNGDKVVVMCTFKDPINEIYNLVNKEYKPLLGTGDIDDQTFNNNIELFQNNPEYKVFLGTVGKAGTSITLNAARYMICINTP